MTADETPAGRKRRHEILLGALRSRLASIAKYAILSPGENSLLDVLDDLIALLMEGL